VKLLLLRINKEKYVPERIKEEAKKLGHQVNVCQYQNLAFKFDPLFQAGILDKKNIADYDGLIFRVAGTTSGSYVAFRDILIAQFLKSGKFCLNGRSYLKFSRLDKLIQHFYLSWAGLPVVRTFCFGKGASVDYAEAQLGKRLGFPIIAKPRFGAQGREIFLLKNESEIKKFYQKTRKKEDISLWLFQEFLSTGCDYRIVVLGGKVLGAMKRVAVKGMIVTNFSQGGSVYSFEPTKKQMQLALKVAKLFNLDYAGVDIMEDKQGNSYVLEVNRACQFKGFEKATGINVAAKIVELLLTPGAEKGAAAA